MPYAPEPLCPAQTELGECLVWDGRREALFWVDILKQELHALDWASRAWTRHPLPSLGGGLVLADDGSLIAGCQSGIYRLDPASFAPTLIVDPEPDVPGNRLNEMKCDPVGRLWVGSMALDGDVPSGSLWCMDGQGLLLRTLGDFKIPNCMVWLEDGQHFLFADSRAKTIWKMRYDPVTAEVLDRAVFADLSADDGIPDGCALDAEGCVWVAQMYDGRVRRFDPAGRQIDEIRLDQTQITTCGFAGPKLDKLVIMTTKRRLDEEGRRRQPLAGDLFMVDAPAPGAPTPVFRRDARHGRSA